MNINVKKLNLTSFLTVMCAGWLMLFGASNASAQPSATRLPHGTWRQTCLLPPDKNGARLISAELIAYCDHKDKGLARVESRLPDVFECEGDIYNDDGRLKCQRNLKGLGMSLVKRPLNTAYIKIFGGNLNDVPYEDGYRLLLRKSFDYNYGGITSDVDMYEFDYIKAYTEFLIKYLNAPENAAVKAKFIDDTFKSVYGAGANPNDLAKYSTQNLVYEDIVNAEKPRLFGDKVIHRLAITAAYQKTMGRPAEPAEFDYWISNQGIYKTIVDANRKYLYAPNGYKDLVETVKRHLGDRGILNPTTEQINDAIKKFKPKKTIYDEM